jgi:hypothetical protein
MHRLILFGTDEHAVRGRNVKSVSRQSMKDKLVKQCLERAKSERLRLLSNARSRSMTSDLSLDQGLNGQELATLVHSAVTDEMSHARDSAMRCDTESWDVRGPDQPSDDSFEGISQDEYIDLMRSLEEEVLQELKSQGAGHTRPPPPPHILDIS